MFLSLTRVVALLSAIVLPLAAQAGPRTHLLIFSGQSNMKHLEPEKSVLPVLKAAFPDDQFITVKYAISGQSISRWYSAWQPAEGGLKEEKEKKGRNRPPGDMYKTLLGMVNDAMKDKAKPDTVTFLWMQGEADTHSSMQWNVYEKSLQGVIAQLRNDLQRPDMGVVIGRISDFNGFPEGSAKIRSALVSVAEKDPKGAWVDTDDLNGKTDGLHYTAEGYQKLGELFAEKAVILLKK